MNLDADPDLLPEDWAEQFQHVRLERQGPVAWLTLNRPEALNATTFRMFDEIECICDHIRDDQDIRALVLTGEGRAFCIGSDLSGLADSLQAETLAPFRNYLDRINKVLFTLEALPIPTVAMVNGKARAGGFEIMLACDFVVIAEEALIGDVHTPFGHMPGAGATQRLPRKIGIQKALELILSGKWLSGKEAVEYGIALKAVPRDQLVAATVSLVSRFTDKVRDSLGQIKRAMLRGAALPLKEGVELETRYYLEYLATNPEPTAAFRQNLRKRREREIAARLERVIAPQGY